MDLVIYQVIGAFLVGIVAGVVGAVSGGGGLVSIPILILIGLPSQVAIATNKCGSFGLGIGATVKFIKEKRILWKYVIPLSVLSIIAGLAGAKLLLYIDKSVLTKITGFIVLLLLPIFFIKKDYGVKNRKTSLLKKIIGLICYFFAMVFAGFFGGGAGFLLFYSLIFFFGFSIIEANAIDIIPWLFLSLSSLIYFMINGVINYYVGGSLFLGMLIGGYLGAHIAIKKGNKWVKNMAVLAIILSSLKILCF